MSSKKWPEELILIRHGRSERNDKKEKAREMKALHHVELPVWCDGSRDQDTPLTVEGYRQAQQVGIELGRRYSTDNKIDVFLVSPYIRTRQTTKSILDNLGYPVKQVTEERVREIEFGILDGLTPEGIRAKYPEEIERRKKEGKYWYRPPGGESRPDVRLRCHSVLDTLVRDYSDQRVVIVCHSVVVLAMRSLLERWDEEQYMQVDKEDDVKNCGITRYAYQPVLTKPELKYKFMIQEYNTVCY